MCTSTLLRRTRTPRHHTRSLLGSHTKEVCAKRGKRREAARSIAKQSVAQRTHAPHTRHTPVHNTCARVTCVVRSRGVSVSSTPTYLCLPYGGFSLCAWRFLSVRWLRAFPCVVLGAAVTAAFAAFRCFPQEEVWGARGCFSTDLSSRPRCGTFQSFNDLLIAFVD